MVNFDRLGTRRALLKRRGIVIALPANDAHSETTMQAIDVELAELGYALSMGLRQTLRSVPIEHLGPLREWLLDELRAIRGAGQKHTPLFRKFPDGVPADTFNLWVDRMLVHFFQGHDQPCLHCGQSGVTQVLNPCLHVVCSACFDGENYSGCPICGGKIDANSPFLVPTKPRLPGAERVVFRVLHEVRDVHLEARTLFQQLCARTQALSPDDRDTLLVLLQDFGPEVLEWIPKKIPRRENIAQIFGALCDALEPKTFEEFASLHMTTATDVLRFIAAYSGADPALLVEERYRQIPLELAPKAAVERLLSSFHPSAREYLTQIVVPQKVRRFKVAKLRRPLRRVLLGILEQLNEENLIEDLHRHSSYWVWVGEFLHPHEYASRFPKVAGAFQIIRKKTPGGDKAPKADTFASRVEEALIAKDISAACQILSKRPGEFGRRLDHLLRLAGPEEVEVVIGTLERIVPNLATPLLLQLSAHFRTRDKHAPVRVYFPAGASVTGVSARDRRKLLDSEMTHRVTGMVEDELMQRFSERTHEKPWIIDAELAAHIVPFNERTASRAAIQLTRGSKVDVPEGKILRLFLHWCEPPNGYTTDLDLSVAFFDEDWQYKNVCSYYELQIPGIAKSSGDFTSAPFPDGASEFVDIHREPALRAGYRFAVMVVTSYSGPPFSALERAFAGLMLRDDDQGLHFDPRTVELKFALNGTNGVFLPIVLDLETQKLHWLDLYSEGQFVFNNVATSTRAVQRICPENIAYFAFGSRPNLFDLGTLHAASRSNQVFIRHGEELRRFDKHPDESKQEFRKRIAAGEGGESGAEVPDTAVYALLLKGNLPLHSDSEILTIFPEALSPTFRASDLL